MNLMQKVIAVFFSLFIFAVQAKSEEAPAFVQFVRPLGMGGAFTAVADDHNVFSFNPAGMVQRTGAQVTLLEIAVGGSTDLNDAYNFIKDNEDDLKNFDTLPQSRQIELVNEINNDISKLDPRATLAADIASFVSGPQFFGMPIHGGFGAFGNVDARFRLDSGAVNPNISYAVNNDLIFPLSIAKRWESFWFIPGKIGVGLTGKYIRRNQIRQDRVSVFQLDDFDAPPVTSGRGIGSDLGFLYQPTSRWNVGVMVQDFLGTKMKFDSLAAEDGFPAQSARDTVIRPRTNLGVAISPRTLLWLLPTGERWTFTADIRDILNEDDLLFFEDGLHKPIGEDLPKHTHLGTEFRYWFLRLRGGAYQGYPTFGLGIDIPIIKLDYAFYSEELGAKSGDRRQELHVVSLALRFGSGATEARERIHKAKEGKKMGRDIAEPEAPSAPAPDSSIPSESPAPETDTIPN